jgi:hypothetical protein
MWIAQWTAMDRLPVVVVERRLINDSMKKLEEQV